MKTFDWHADPIALETVILDNYRGTQNVRRFFVTQCGADFRLDRSFMAWMKSAQGKTMREAVAEWKRRRI